MYNIIVISSVSVNIRGRPFNYLKIINLLNSYSDLKYRLIDDRFSSIIRSIFLIINSFKNILFS